MKSGPAYSHEEKIAIIREHTEKHRTLREICEEYGISKSYLCYLLKQYRENGKNGISTTRYYSEAYKLRVVKCHYEDGATIMELVQETGIQYDQGMVEPLCKRRLCRTHHSQTWKAKGDRTQDGCRTDSSA